MRLIGRASYRSMPWKNGAGSTTQIAVYPADATVDDFDWRISTATIAADGAFSNFPGVDRTLAVLESAGIALTVAGKPAARLTRAAAPFSFAADAAAHARLVDGPILDLNVRTRRDRFSHCVRRGLAREAGVALGATTVVYAYSAKLRLNVNGQSRSIEMGDTAIFGADTTSLSIAAQSPGDYYLVAFAALDRSGPPSG
jgi:environmental stress-induced protein Ves